MHLLLIFVGLILVILNVLSIRKQNKSFNGVLGDALENTHDCDIRIGEIRREFSESILELQSQIMGMKEIMEKNNDKNSSYLENVTYMENNKKNHDKSKNEIIKDESHNSNSEKVEGIKRLFSEGLSVEEISEMMHLGKGEVLLIKDLYIR